MVKPPKRKNTKNDIILLDNSPENNLLMQQITLQDIIKILMDNYD